MSSKLYRHLSEDLLSIQKLFSDVENGYKSADSAFRDFLTAFGGYYVYVPKNKRPKASRILLLLDEGLTPAQISERLGVTRRWVYYVRTKRTQ